MHREFAINLWRRLDLEWIAPSTEPRLTVEQAMEVFRQWRALNTNGWSADAIWENLFTCLAKAAKQST